MKTIQHTSFVSLYNKNPKVFELIFKDTNTLTKLTNKIIKVSKGFQTYAYPDQDKLKGDLFEIFAECFFKIMSAHPGIGIYNYQNAPIDEVGLDAFGIGMDQKPATIQVKFRSDPTTELTQEDINQLYLYSIAKYGVDKDTKTNIIVFTNATGLHWKTESITLLGRVKALGNKEISYLIDNNSVFWNELQDMIQYTIKEKYELPEKV